MQEMTAANANGQRVGYKRVSTADQKTLRQLEGVAVDTVFEDKVSGKDTNRPQLQEALKFVRRGDVLVIHSLDRLARNLVDLRRIVEDLNGRGVVVEFLKNGLVFDGSSSATSKLMLNMLGMVAEFERDMMLERQREGIAIAKAAGVYKGRKARFDAATITLIRKRVDAGENVSAIARDFGTSRPTIYRALGG
jgi:DNA invertase Pin-like site-specific DNA recombinase